MDIERYGRISCAGSSRYHASDYEFKQSKEIHGQSSDCLFEARIIFFSYF